MNQLFKHWNNSKTCVSKSDQLFHCCRFCAKTFEIFFSFFLPNYSLATSTPFWRIKCVWEGTRLGDSRARIFRFVCDDYETLYSECVMKMTFSCIWWQTNVYDYASIGGVVCSWNWSWTDRSSESIAYYLKHVVLVGVQKPRRTTTTKQNISQ